MTSIPELYTFGRLLYRLGNTAIPKKERIQILRDTLVTNDSAVARLWVYTLSPYITFGISEIQKDYSGPGPDQGVGFGYPITWESLIHLLDDLVNRRVTGNAASASTKFFYDQLNTPEEKRGFAVLISKTPRCRVSTATVNEAFPGLIPTFGVAKAEEWRHADKARIPLIKNGCIVERKENGHRAIFIAEKNLLLSSSGKPLVPIEPLIPHIRKQVGENVVLDGELVLGDGDLHGLKKFTNSKNRYSLDEIIKAGLRYVVFDVLSIEEWSRQESRLSQHVRTEWVHGVKWEPPVYAVDSWRLQGEHIEDVFVRILAHGGEGIILKDPASTYAFKRHKCWIKRKLEQTEDVPIVGLLPGEKGGKYENTLGRFVVLRPNGVQVNASCGQISDLMRNEIWSDPHKYIGKIVEVKYQEETPDGSLQHPRVMRFRDE